MELKTDLVTISKKLDAKRSPSMGTQINRILFNI